LYSLNYLEKNNFNTNNSNNLKINHFLNNFKYGLKNFSKFLYFNNVLQLLNDDSDKKKIFYPIYKINNFFEEKAFLSN
jgi:hypothetical protein